MGQAEAATAYGPSSIQKEGNPVNEAERAEAVRLDTWLAVQVAAGVRFTAYLIGENQGPCTMVAYSQETRPGGDYCSHMKLLNCGDVQTLYDANDANGGDPAAVRAALHRLYPFLTAMPAPRPSGHPLVTA